MLKKSSSFGIILCIKETGNLIRACPAFFALEFFRYEHDTCNKSVK